MAEVGDFIKKKIFNLRKSIFKSLNKILSENGKFEYLRYEIYSISIIVVF